jgi:Mn-dependent DtxR family transcriptional regulator
MTHDRVESDQFMLTQQTAAQVMGVRRMSITPIAKKLKDEGLIRYGRGSITILDRKALEAASCECYVRIAHVYDALLEQISQ